jgi:hypothetical protein
MAHGKPGGPDVKLKRPKSAPVGGGPGTGPNLSNHQEMTPRMPKMGGKPGGRQPGHGGKQGPTKNYNGRSASVPNGSGKPGGAAV